MKKKCSRCKKLKSEAGFYLGHSECKICWIVSVKKYQSRPDIKERRKQYYDRRNKRLKREVLESYGGIKCKCCGETCIEFLSLDHIGGGGKKHREQIGGGSKNFYYKLKQLNFPDKNRIRVLCMNCQFATAFSEICPHKRRGK
jgi:hypothetical protein